MAPVDDRGNPCGPAPRVAREAVERALGHLMVFDDTPLAALDEAIAHAPGWLLPRVVKAGFLLGLTETGLRAEAAALLQAAAPLAADAPPRERAHLEAVQHLLGGRWHQACRIWDALLIDHPRDALALQWAHLWDFHRGDVLNLRGRPARVLAEWDRADPLYPHVLALHAFGLEENHLHAEAEDTGRRALALQPRAPWAVHAVAHVMDAQGRFEDGAAWLRQHQAHWAPDNGFAVHLWWHKALFRLEAGDRAGVLRLVDSHLSGDALQLTLQRLDAASMLWRLHLLGDDVSAHAAALVEGWALAPDEDPETADASGRPRTHPGLHAFNDLHVVLAQLAAGRVGEAEQWVARCAARALEAGDAGRANHAVAREIGLPLMRGALALAQGDGQAAADQIYPVRGAAQRLGGSHAQRDLIDQTLLAAAALGPRALGRALLNERLLAKPATPLTRHWQALLAVDEPERA